VLDGRTRTAPAVVTPQQHWAPTICSARPPFPCRVRGHCSHHAGRAPVAVFSSIFAAPCF